MSTKRKLSLSNISEEAVKKTKSETSPFMILFPTEIVFYIAEYFELNDVIAFRAACKSHHDCTILIEKQDNLENAMASEVENDILHDIEVATVDEIEFSQTLEKIHGMILGLSERLIAPQLVYENDASDPEDDPDTLACGIDAIMQYLTYYDILEPGVQIRFNMVRNISKCWIVSKINKYWDNVGEDCVTIYEPVCRGYLPLVIIDLFQVIGVDDE